MIASDIESVAASNVICHLTFLGTETSQASSGIGSFSLSLSLSPFLSLARRPECHLRQLVPDGLLRHGGTGLSQDPAPPHHRPHGGASLPPAAASRRRDVHQGEGVGGASGGLVIELAHASRK